MRIKKIFGAIRRVITFCSRKEVRATVDETEKYITTYQLGSYDLQGKTVHIELQRNETVSNIEDDVKITTTEKTEKIMEP